MAWLERELPEKFNELTHKDEGNQQTLEKREENTTNGASADNKGAKKGGSILERIKPRSDVKGKRVKSDENAEENPVKQEQTGEDGETPERTKKDPKKVRCTFWPGCKNADCPFVHPTEPVA